MDIYLIGGASVCVSFPDATALLYLFGRKFVARRTRAELNKKSRRSAMAEHVV
jgi:hypothetical protein